MRPEDIRAKSIAKDILAQMNVLIPRHIAQFPNGLEEYKNGNKTKRTKRSNFSG